MILKIIKKLNRAIIGYGGHAREVAVQMNEPVTFFVDDSYVTDNTLPLSKFNPFKYEIIVAISDSAIRKRIISSLPIETKYFTFIHPTSLIMDDNIEIGEGSFIGAHSIITTNIKLGNHSILNRGCHIGHDSIIGDYLSMMPNSVISGNCKIGNNVYFGTNSSVKQKIQICDNVVIGMNAAVVKDIEEAGIYVGVPAKQIK